MVICRYFYYSNMKDYWNSLNMYERNEFIKTAIKNGFRDPIEIRRKYNEFAEGGELEDTFVNPYNHGDVYNVSPECAYFSNHTLNDQGYMMSGNAWTPRGIDVVFDGFNSDLKPKKFSEEAYDNFAVDAVNNVYTNFNTRETLDPNQVYTVNMFYKNSPNKEKAFKESNGAYGTHTGYLNYEPEDDTWYVTHNIHNKIYKQRFGDLQNPKGNVGVTAIYKPRKNNLFNRVRTKLGFAEGGYLDTTEDTEQESKDKEQESREFQRARMAEIHNHPDRHIAKAQATRIKGGSSEFDKARGHIT